MVNMARTHRESLHTNPSEGSEDKYKSTAYHGGVSTNTTQLYAAIPSVNTSIGYKLETPTIILPPTLMLVQHFQTPGIERRPYRGLRPLELDT